MKTMPKVVTRKTGTKVRGVTTAVAKTHEGGAQYAHTMNHALEFFAKAGSLFVRKEGTFYHDEATALALFQAAWAGGDEVLAMKLLFWLRDCRGGAGNRSGFRECINWLANYEPEWVRANIKLVPEYGRWDDLRSLDGTTAGEVAFSLWADALKNGDVLAAKWADRKDKGLQSMLGLNEAALRKLLSGLRKLHIVEAKMCSGDWQEIEYHTVPSVAMARYAKAFATNDSDRFEEFKGAVETGEVDIKAGVLFPHDCIRTAKSGSTDIADLQFDALPNYLEEVDERVIVISDTSASMNQSVAGQIQAMEVSQGMALYCSAKIPADNPFHKKFITFCDEGRLVDWNGMKFSDAVRSRQIFNGAIGSTRIDRALMTILETAQYFNLTQEQMPTSLIVVSDMQFSQGTVAGSGTEVERCLDRWKAAGYKVPKIIYWNTAGYAGAPADVKSTNVGMVSGFSTSILKAIFAGDDLTPKGVMLRAIEKYPVVRP